MGPKRAGAAVGMLFIAAALAGCFGPLAQTREEARVAVESYMGPSTPMQVRDLKAFRTDARLPPELRTDYACGRAESGSGRVRRFIYDRTRTGLRVEGHGDGAAFAWSWEELCNGIDMAAHDRAADAAERQDEAPMRQHFEGRVKAREREIARALGLEGLALRELAARLQQ